jgi:hypothetical protein
MVHKREGEREREREALRTKYTLQRHTSITYILQPTRLYFLAHSAMNSSMC